MTKKKTNQYRSVADLVRDLSEDRAFTKEFGERLSRRQLIKVLTVLRSRAGLSQQELAQKLGCTQSKVSKLEGSGDADVRLGDVVDYAVAVGHEVRVFLVPKGQTIVEEAKMHAFVIKRLLNRLAELAGDDEATADGVSSFLSEAFYDLGKVVGSAARLPPLAEQGSSPLLVESVGVEEDSGDSETTRARPERVRESTASR